MRTIAVVNQKGGSCKTTTALNLSATLAEQGRRVLVIDLDPQANISSWFGFGEEQAGRAMLDVLTQEATIADIERPTNVEGVSLAPSSSWLVGAERALAQEVGAESVLRRQLRGYTQSVGDDVAAPGYILLDCPPTLGVLTVNALAAASEVLVSVEAHVLALSGLVQLQNTVDIVRERLNPDLELSGIVACRVDNRTRHAREIVEQLRQHYGNVVYNTVIRENVRVAESPSFCVPVTVYDNSSYGATDYRALAEEIIAKESEDRGQEKQQINHR